MRTSSKPPSYMPLHLCTPCASSSTILCPSFSSTHKTSEIERMRTAIQRPRLPLHSPNFRSWLSRGVGGPARPLKGTNQLGLYRRGCFLSPRQARPSATSKCTKSVLREVHKMMFQSSYHPRIINALRGKCVLQVICTFWCLCTS